MTPTVLATAALVAAAPTAAFGQQGGAAGAPARPAPERSGHVEANGVSYYYEIHGRGEPLLLLHGGLGSLDMFGPVLPALAAGRQVIAVDLHGHGRTALGDRPLRMIDMGDDLAAVLAELGYEQVGVLGYSLGGGLRDAGWMRENMSPNRLAILPGRTHYDIFFAPELVSTVLPFLNGESNTTDWADQMRR